MRANYFSKIRRILCFVALICVLQLLLNQTAGLIASEVFARGTGCSVSLSSPRVWLPSASATIEEVAIVCPGESEGFRAERLEISVSILSLFRKLVLIDYLRIDGASVRSINDDSALFKTLEFIFKDGNKPSSRSWHSFLTADWRAWAPKTEIFSKQDNETHLVVGADSFWISGSNISFLAEDPTGRPEDPVQMTARADNVRVSTVATKSRSLGTLRGKATLGSKILKILRAELKKEINAPYVGESLQEISGTVRFTDENEGYELTAHGSISNSLISELLLPELEHAPLRRAKFTYSAELRGEILSPEIEGVANLAIEDGDFIVPRSECMPNLMSANFYASNDAVRIENLLLDGIVRQGAFSLALDEAKTFSSSFSLNIDDSSEFAKRCFPLVTGKLGAEGKSIYPGALAESTTKVEVNGGFSPLDVSASIVSDVQASDVVNRSTLTSNIHYRDEKLEFDLAEKFNLARIEPRQGLIKKEQSSRPMTPFRAEKQAVLSVGLKYDLKLNSIQFDRLQIQHYPSAHLLRRAAPFLDREIFDFGRRTFRPESLVDADGGGTFDLSQGKGRGAFTFAVTNLSIMGLPVEKIVSKVSLSDKGIALNDSTLFTRKGSASGRVSVAIKGDLQGRLSFDQLDVSQFVDDSRRDSIMPIDGELLLSGTVAQPKLTGEVIARTQGRTATSLAMSSLRVSASKEELLLDGSLFSEAAQFSLRYPLSGSVDSKFHIAIAAKSLSIEELLNAYQARRSESRSPSVIPNTVDSESRSDAGVVSGTFEYDGDPDDLFSGVGLLRLSEVDLGGDLLKVVNADEVIATLDNGRLVFKQVGLRVGTERIDLRGYLDINSGWNAKIVGKVPLARTVLSLPVVEYVTGDIKVDVAISGQYDDPELKGGINLEGGGISIPVGNTVLGASDVSTKVLFSGTTISIPTLTAKVGGGVLVGSALLRNSFDDLERSFEVNMNLDRITLEPIDNFSSRISGEARIRAEALGVPEVWARLRVLDAIYEDEVDLTQILRTMTKRILGREDARATGATGGSRDSGKSGQIIALDLEVKAEDGLIIETNIAEVELGASLAVLGTTKNPKVDGRVYTIDGVFGFEGTRFDIIKGDLQFSGTAERPDPRVNIVGETSVSTLEYGEQKVQIIIEGSLTEPEVTFTSDAGLSREEILRIISSGAGVRGLELFGGKTKEYTFKELVSLRSDVGLLDRLRGLTGVTTVEITTGLSSSTGEFVPTVVAKRPFTDKLALQIESELAGEKTSKLSVEYPLTPFLSLVGGWTDNPPTADGSESSGSFSVGFNYRRAFPPMLSPFRTLIKKRED